MNVLIPVVCLFGGLIGGFIWGVRLATSQMAMHKAYVSGWKDALANRRVVMAVATKFLKEDV